MNPQRWEAKKKLMNLLEKIVRDFCETHTDEQTMEAMAKLDKIVERAKQRRQERKQRNDNGLRSV